MAHQTRIEDSDFITIIGGDMAAITRQFQAQGLSGSDYAIVHRVGRHHFTMVEGDTAERLFEGRRLIAATFARRHPVAAALA